MVPHGGLLVVAESVSCWGRATGKLWLPLQIGYRQAAWDIARIRKFEFVLRAHNLVHQLEGALGKGRLVALLGCHALVCHLSDRRRSVVVLVLVISVGILAILGAIGLLVHMLPGLHVRGRHNDSFVLAVHFRTPFILSSGAFLALGSLFVEVLGNSIDLSV